MYTITNSNKELCGRLSSSFNFLNTEVFNLNSNN